jgi:hypothetical protein
MHEMHRGVREDLLSVRGEMVSPLKRLSGPEGWRLRGATEGVPVASSQRLVELIRPTLPNPNLSKELEATPIFVVALDTDEVSYVRHQCTAKLEFIQAELCLGCVGYEAIVPPRSPTGPMERPTADLPAGTAGTFRHTLVECDGRANGAILRGCRSEGGRHLQVLST